MDSEVSHSFACRVKDTLPSSAGSLCLKVIPFKNPVHLCFFPFFFLFSLFVAFSFSYPSLPPPIPLTLALFWLLPFSTNGAMNPRQKQLHQRCFFFFFFLLNCQLIGSIFQRTDKTSALHAGTGVPCDITRYLRTNICYFCDSVVR